MRNTSGAWKTCSPCMKSRCRKRNPWSVSMRSRSCCMPISALAAPAARTNSSARLRVRAPWHGQRVLRSAAEGGTTFTRVTPDRSSPEFADYLLRLLEYYPGADTIHLVMDNLSSHTRKAVVERFGEKAGGWLWERFTVHYTPKHGSWLNQAEIEISLFSRQCLGPTPHWGSSFPAEGSQGLGPENEP